MCSYIASLEEQQISLLSALRDLRQQVPNDRVVCDTIEQLQRKGFDVDSLKFKDQHKDSSKVEARTEQGETAQPFHISWDYDQLSMNEIQSLLQQPATPQAVSDLLLHFGDASSQNFTQVLTQQTPWQVHDGFPVSNFQGSMEPMVDPMQDFYVDPTQVSFDPFDPRAASTDQNST